MNLTDLQKQSIQWALVAVLFIWALVALGQVLTPFVAAAIIGYAIEPMVRWLHRHKVPRILAVLLTLLVTFVAGVALVLTLLPILQEEVVLIRTQLPAAIGGLSDRLNGWLQHSFGSSFRLDANHIRTWVAAHLSSSSDEVAAVVLSYLKTGSSKAASVLGLVFLVPVVLFYLLLDWDVLVNKLRNLIPMRWRQSVYSFAGETNGIVGQWLRGQLLVMIILAAYYSVGLLLAGFDLWLPLGVLTGTLVVIPYLGFTLGLILAIIAGVLQFELLRGLISIAIVYGIGQALESTFLTPKLVGERIGLHPLAVILALLAFGSLFGFVGVLLALPLAAIFAVGLRRLREEYVTSEFFRS